MYCLVRYKGSFTIEAALIMPVILGVIVLFIYYSVFAHDRCALEYICETACSQSVYDELSCEEYAEYHIRSALPKYLILDWETDISVYSDETCVYAEIAAKPPFLNRTFEHKTKAFKHFCPKY